MREAQDPLLRSGQRHEWTLCREPGCSTRVRRELLCDEHIERDGHGRKISTLKYCQAEGCWDKLPADGPRDHCGLHEDRPEGRSRAPAQAELEAEADSPDGLQGQTGLGAWA